jgi:bacterioferritin (cytochrome b1)
MFEQLIPKIPLHEAAGFFYRVKNAEWGDPPDLTGELEGQFNVPAPQVAGFLAKVITAKFQMVMAYYTYAESMRDLAQHPIGEVFHEHAGHELEAAEYYLKRAAVLGGPVSLEPAEPPPASTDPVHIIQVMMRAEQEAIALQRQLRDMVGDANPMKIEVEEKLAQDQHHLDELWQMLPSEVHDAAQGALAAAAPPPAPVGEGEAVQAAGESEPKEPPAEKKPVDTKEAALRMRMKLAARKLADLNHLTGLAAGGAAGRYLGGHLGGPLGKEVGTVLGGAVGLHAGHRKSVEETARHKMASALRKLSFGPPLDEYLASHQMGQEAQQQNEAEFYRNKLQEMQASGQATTQQLADLQAQLAQAQEQQASVGATIQAANEEAMAARDDALQHAQLEANMRLGIQKMQQQILQIASQDPSTLGSLPTDLPPGSGQGMVPGMADPSMGGMAAMPGAAPAEGVGPGQPGATPQATAPNEVPAESGGPGAPGATKPSNGQSGSSSSNPTATAGSTKIGAIRDHAAALGGAALGALAGGAKALGKGKELPERTQALESATAANDGSFASMLAQAKARAGVAESENAMEHPVRTALAGGLKGGLMGAAAGSMAGRLAGNLGQLFQ